MRLPQCFDAYTSIWGVDFEFTPRLGDLPRPICVVAHELRSGRHNQLWEDDLQRCTIPPYDVGRSSLFVAYAAQAELSCHVALHWPFPARILDLFTEFRNETNGLDLDHGQSLLGALAYFGLEGLGV